MSLDQTIDNLEQAAALGEDDQPSCFNCDDMGWGMYKVHEGRTNWYIGHRDGQGHYACEECKDLLFDPVLLQQL